MWGFLNYILINKSWKKSDRKKNDLETLHKANEPLTHINFDTGNEKSLTGRKFQNIKQTKLLL